MVQLPDVYCWIKVLDDDKGKALPDGAQIIAPHEVTVRYVIANDSNKPAGPLSIVGTLHRNGVKVQPGGQPNVVPAQLITLQPGQIWKKEYPISENAVGAYYVAKLLGDVGNFVNEEDDTNNIAKKNFSFTVEPPK